MEQGKYFNELARVLNKKGIETEQADNNSLPVLSDGAVACRINMGGLPFRFPDDLTGADADAQYHRAATVAAEVHEYMVALESAPYLAAVDLDEKFRLLSEFNGAVLAARQMEKGYGMMFVTWQRSYDGSGVIWGHYYQDDYQAAKEDFAIRAGLVKAQRIFSPEQMVEIYRSADDTLNTGYASAESEEILGGIQEQIRIAVPDVDERITRQSYAEHGFNVDSGPEIEEGGMQFG